MTDKEKTLIENAFKKRKAFKRLYLIKDPNTLIELHRYEMQQEFALESCKMLECVNKLKDEKHRITYKNHTIFIEFTEAEIYFSNKSEDEPLKYTLGIFEEYSNNKRDCSHIGSIESENITEIPQKLETFLKGYYGG